MFAITIRERSGQVYTFHFDKPEVLIGRVKGNDVILPKQNISKRHTLVRTQGKRFIVEDLGSTNGTYVNGHRTTTAVEIGPDDKVYLGDFVMNFTDLTDMAAGIDMEPPSVPDIPIQPGPSEETPANVRATQHMQSPPVEADAPAVPATPAPVSPQRDPFGSDLPPVELLDMPSELMEQPQLPEDGVDFLDRLTGPLDGLHAALPRGSHDSGGSALASIPGLAAALRPPARAHESAADAPDFDGPDGASHFQMGSYDAPKSASPAAARPAPASPDSAAGQERPQGYHDRLGGLFRGAMQELRPSLPTDTAQMSDSDWAELEERVTGLVERAAQAGHVDAADELQQICRDLIYELTGFGPLEPMLDDATIESIEVNAFDQLYVVRDGRREPSSERFSCQQALALSVDRLVRATGHNARTGTHLEGTLVDGTSIYVVWPPACPNGPAIVLRKPRSDAPELELLVARGTVSAHAAEVLARLTGERRSIAIVGIAGVGKRTVLNALGMLFDTSTRLAVLEDGQRLRLRAEQVVRIDAAVLGEGGPSPLQVVQRLRADVALIGDAAGLELDQLFSVSSDALPTWLGVFQARSADDFVERAVHAIMMRYPGLAEAVARARVLRGLDAVAVFAPDGAGNQVLSEIHEVTRAKGKSSLVQIVPD